MKKFNHCLLTILSFFLISCGGNAVQSQDSTANQKEKVQTEKIENQKLCFFNNIEQLCTIFPEEFVTPYASGKEVLRDSENFKTSKGSINFCRFSWPGEGTRDMKVSNMVVKVPNECNISLSGVKLIDSDDPVADFNRYYRSVSEEDMSKLKKDVNEDIDESEEIADASKETGKALGGSVLSELNKFTYEEIEGLADAAKWETSTSKMLSPTSGSLFVQYGKERFSLLVDVGGSAEASKAAAIEIAHKLLAACK